MTAVTQLHSNVPATARKAAAPPRSRPFFLAFPRAFFRSLSLCAALLLFAGSGSFAQCAPDVASPIPPPTHDEHPPEATPDACPPAGGARPISLTGYKAVCMGANLPEVQHIRDAWESVLVRHDNEAVYGCNITLLTPPVLQQWRNLAAMMPKLAPEQKLQYINGFYNNWPSAKDAANYGEEEYWASPEEFLDKGGDCEDYAIVKYHALRYFSWPGQDLWVVLVENKKDGEKHAVLAARNGDRTFILDNLSRPAYLLIPEMAYMKTFTPLFAVNESGLWMFASQSAARPKN